MRKIFSRRQIFPATKKPAYADLVNQIGSLIGWIDTLAGSLSLDGQFVKTEILWAWTRRELNPVGLGVEPMPDLV